MVCPAKASSSRLAGRKSWGINLAARLDRIILIWIEAMLLPAMVPVLYLQWQQFLMVDSHAPSFRSSIFQTIRTYRSQPRGQTPAPRILGLRCCGRRGSKMHAASTVSNDMFGESNHALRLRDDPPILQLPQ